MSEYSSKLSVIAAKKKKLLEEEAKLIEKRKKEISLLAERINLLSSSNELIAGIFIHAGKALASNNKELIKEWETEGAKFLKPSKQTKHASKNQTSSVEVN